MRGLIHIAIVACCLAASPSWATDRYFRDQSVLSPNGRYQLEAKSPDNAGPNRRPFARNFVYSLYDTQTGDLVWQRAQPKDEGSPLSVYLHDEGWVAVQTSHEDLFLLNPVTAKKTFEFDILKSFTEEERDEHVHDTTAGPMWEGHSRWYYLEDGENLLFVIRPAWGRRLIVDVLAGKLLRRDDPRVVQACQDAESAFVLNTLNDAALDVARYERDDDYRAVANVQTAVIIAAQNRDPTAVPFLRALQHSNYSGSSGGWMDFDGVYKPGEINPFSQIEMTLRRQAHDALRLLGEKPEELPCTLFSVVGGAGGQYAHHPPLDAPRATRVDLVTPGMTPLEVMCAIGTPDYVNYQEAAWEYHMDTDKPYTLLVSFEDRKRVNKTAKLEPPMWQRGDEWLKRLQW